MSPASIVHRLTLASVAVLLLSVLAGCGVQGSGFAAHDSRRVESFAGLRVGSDIEATVVVGDLAPLELDGDDNMLPLVDTRVEGGVLVITPSTTIDPDLPLKVRVTIPTLTSLTATSSGRIVGHGLEAPQMRLVSSGGSSIVLESVSSGELSIEASGASTVSIRSLSAADVSLDASGSSDVLLTGVGAHVDASLSGSSSLASEGFPSDTLHVDASGSSSAIARITQSVDGSISGSSDLWIYGSPPVHRVQTSGSSTVDYR